MARRMGCRGILDPRDQSQVSLQRLHVSLSLALCSPGHQLSPRESRAPRLLRREIEGGLAPALPRRLDALLCCFLLCWCGEGVTRQERAGG